MNRITILILFSIILTACGGGGGTPSVTTVTPTFTISGRVIDPPVSGSRVFLDLNCNKQLDSGEYSATSTPSGFFGISLPRSIDLDTDCGAQIVSVGGVDTSDNTAPQTATLVNNKIQDIDDANVVLSPLSTVSSYLNEAEVDLLLDSLGITDSAQTVFEIDIWSKEEEDPTNDLLNSNLVLNNLLSATTSLFGEASDAEKVVIQEVFADTLITQIATLSDRTLIYDDFNQIKTLSESLVANLSNASSNTLNATLNAAVANVNLNSFYTQVVATNILIQSSATDFSGSSGLAILNASKDFNVELSESLERGASDAIATLIASFNSDLSDGSIDLDTDGDGIGNNTDTDDDGDGVGDSSDAFPLLASETIDTDGDGIGNNTDTDDDGDGVGDSSDAFPLLASETIDTDGDGIGNNADTDDDNDSVLDINDAFPLLASESVDTDNDGVGNNADTDDDNDGVLDTIDDYPLNKYVHTAPTAFAQAVSVTLLSESTNSKAITLGGSAQDNRSLTFSIVTQPTLGTISLNENTGVVTYLKSDSLVTDSLLEMISDNFSYRVYDGYVYSTAADVTIDFVSDPLYLHQWNLSNIGDSTRQGFADQVGFLVADEDINVAPVHNRSITGNGVSIAIIDTGLEITHEDLASNVIPGSYNFINGSADPSPEDISYSDHGTMVAGVAAAVGWNNIGVRGVAPKASILGRNLLKNWSTANHEISVGLSSDVALIEADIYNRSYGISPVYAHYWTNDLINHTDIYNIQQNSFLNGSVSIKAASNSFGFDNSVSHTFGHDNCLPSYDCHPSYMDEENIWPSQIVVGAFNGEGVKSSYSSTGSNLWISAPAGETGHQFSAPAIITTENSGCSAGKENRPVYIYNYLDHLSSLGYEHACNYTGRMGGTSSAAPTVSGVVALILEANPSLQPRDIKYILAKTARKIDPDMIPLEFDNILNGGWITNAAGYNFNNWYGFGAVDADAAVAAAQSDFESLPPRLVGTLSHLEATPEVIIAGMSYEVDLLAPAGLSFVEDVSISIDLTSDPNVDISLMGVEITSPSGTVSTIIQPAVGSNAMINDYILSISNAFYGEEAEGVWTVTFWNKGLENISVSSTFLTIGGH